MLPSCSTLGHRLRQRPRGNVRLRMDLRTAVLGEEHLATGIGAPGDGDIAAVELAGEHHDAIDQLGLLNGNRPSPTPLLDRETAVGRRKIGTIHDLDPATRFGPRGADMPPHPGHHLDRTGALGENRRTPRRNRPVTGVASETQRVSRYRRSFDTPSPSDSSKWYTSSPRTNTRSARFITSSGSPDHSTTSASSPGVREPICSSSPS